MIRLSGHTAALRLVECVVDHAWELHTQSRSPVLPHSHTAMEALEGPALPVVHPTCCGIDVYQAPRTPCLRRVTENGQVTQEVRACATTYLALLAWLDFLRAAQ
jgi:hypothetical protein